MRRDDGGAGTELRVPGGGIPSVRGCGGDGDASIASASEPRDPGDEDYFFLTWRLTVALCLSAPLAPLIVNVTAPIFVVDVVATDSVDDCAVGTSTGFGLNVGVEFAGRPLTLRLTGPVKPLSGVI